MRRKGDSIDTYYRELATSTSPARRVGWERRLAQGYRFELVRQVLEQGNRLGADAGSSLFASSALEGSRVAAGPEVGGVSLLDVGAGACGLATYLRERHHGVWCLERGLTTGECMSPRNEVWVPMLQCGIAHRCSVRYLGIDRYPHLLETNLPETARVLAPFDEVAFADKWDIGVAVGTLSGSSFEGLDDPRRHDAFLQLLAYLRSKAKTFILLTVDLDRLDEHPWRRDAAISGVRESWLRDLVLVLDLRYYWVSREELAIVPEGVVLSRSRAYWGAIRGPFGGGKGAEWGWLAERVGMEAVACEMLRGVSSGDPLGEVVRERLEGRKLR